LVDDPAKALIPGATVTAINTQTGGKQSTTTNKEGQYVLPGLNPGTYRIEVDKPGFKGIIEAGLTLHVQDAVQINFHMAVGSSSESITVSANQNNINTTDGSVSTVIDNQFVANIPLNGRSFQDLETLAPGVVLVGGGVGGSGEFAVNGQRTEANYFAVDGVTVNTGTTPSAGPGAFMGAGVSGNTPGETILGTTQSMVSIDALQEFRANTSTYSAEYGRTPGGQFSFTTRSGTNTWNGSAYDYFRNEVLDANNWFNNHASPQVPRLPERQNDFGGTLGGPVIIPHLYNGKDKTFFFFSYEGLRLTIPRPISSIFVPDIALRQVAAASMKPYLDAFPIPNGGEDGLNDGVAIYNLAYSSPSSLDSSSIRVDHNFNEKLSLFGRFASTPSSQWTYNPAKNSESINVQTLTVGSTYLATSTQANEFHFNLTQSNSIQSEVITNLGGAVPFDFSALSTPSGSPATIENTSLSFALFYGEFPNWEMGQSRNSQQQYNVVDTYSWSRGVHQFKFGVDWRRLSTLAKGANVLGQAVYPYSNNDLITGDVSEVDVFLNTSFAPEPVFHNVSTFAQDEWKITSRLALSLGLRWDINPPPGDLNGPLAYTVDQIANLATTKLAPENTPLYRTDWRAFAPRVGIAYQVRRAPGRETQLRTGFGVFYDTGNALASQGYVSGVGFRSTVEYFGVSVPLTSAQLKVPPPSAAPPYLGGVYGFDPNLKLPYTMQWNFSIEQALGNHQSVTLGYIASGGRKLLTQYEYSPENFGNANFSACSGCLYYTTNAPNSDYNSLQVKYQRRLSAGLQALVSYTFSHSIDDASSNLGGGGLTADALQRASSDFDIRHNFQAALTYDVPGSYSNSFAAAALEHWGVDLRASARSGLPVDVISNATIDPITGLNLNLRPDLIPGEPLYLYGSQYPGGRVINYAAFSAPMPGEYGDTPRNVARGFDAVGFNLALRRDFPIRERLRLQFRAEAFNIANHPSFAGIYRDWDDGPNYFGHSSSTLNNALGGLNPLYQTGGPRSLQLALKLVF
jgi:hypothetical protein